MKDTRPQIFLESSKVDTSQLIGVPYEEKDCWGVCTNFYLLHGYQIPQHYSGAPNDQEIAFKYVEHAKDFFNKVPKPIYGDFVLINLLGFPSHCGIYLGNNKFLHTKRTTGSIIDNLPRWKNRIVGYYRLKYDKVKIKST